MNLFPSMNNIWPFKRKVAAGYDDFTGLDRNDRIAIAKPLLEQYAAANGLHNAVEVNDYLDNLAKALEAGDDMVPRTFVDPMHENPETPEQRRVRHRLHYADATLRLAAMREAKRLKGDGNSASAKRDRAAGQARDVKGHFA